MLRNHLGAGKGGLANYFKMITGGQEMITILIYRCISSNIRGFARSRRRSEKN